MPNILGPNDVGVNHLYHINHLNDACHVAHGQIPGEVKMVSSGGQPRHEWLVGMLLQGQAESLLALDDKSRRTKLESVFNIAVEIMEGSDHLSNLFIQKNIHDPAANAEDNDKPQIELP